MTLTDEEGKIILVLMKKKKDYSSIFVPVIVIFAVLFVWQLICMAGVVPGYMLPAPTDVFSAFAEDYMLLLEHAQVTLLEAFLGLLIGMTLGFLSAALMDAFPIVRKGLYPVLVLTQTIPPVAIAPLLVLWFSYGIAPKVVLVVLVSFFPVAIGLYEGFRNTDPDMIRLMKSMNATRWQIFCHVKFPGALPEFFSGLKIAVSYSVVGAVIAEWLGGYSGLGVYMTRVKKAYAYDKMFAVIIFVSVISLILMGLVKLLQKKCTPWLEGKNG